MCLLRRVLLFLDATGSAHSVYKTFALMMRRQVGFFFFNSVNSKNNARVYDAKFFY